MKIYDLDTPAVLIDIDRVERNLARLAGYCREHNLRLRPHTKTHKLPEMAHLQLKHGAGGITVAKVGEAEVMATGGMNDILIAYPVVGASKAARVAELAKDRRVSVSLDSLESAEGLSRAADAAGATIDILIEIDTGFHRCGLAPVHGPGGELLVVALARRIETLPGVRFEGIMFYPGHIRTPPSEQAAAIAANNAIVEEALDALSRAGIACPVVSGGSTPTWPNSHTMPRVTEIRSGTYIFNDRNTVDMEAARPADCAFTVLTTVVSTAVDRQMIIDGGSKTFSSDTHRGGRERGYGEVVGRPDLVLMAMSEEHGHVSAPEGLRGLRVGDKVRLLINHVCACQHLHEKVYLHRGEEVIDCLRVAGRGKLQ